MLKIKKNSLALAECEVILINLALMRLIGYLLPHVQRAIVE